MFVLVLVLGSGLTITTVIEMDFEVLVAGRRVDGSYAGSWLIFTALLRYREDPSYISSFLLKIRAPDGPAIGRELSVGLSLDY